MHCAQQGQVEGRVERLGPRLGQVERALAQRDGLERIALAQIHAGMQLGGAAVLGAVPGLEDLGFGLLEELQGLVGLVPDAMEVRQRGQGLGFGVEVADLAGQGDRALEVLVALVLPAHAFEHLAEPLMDLQAALRVAAFLEFRVELEGGAQELGGFLVGEAALGHLAGPI